MRREIRLLRPRLLGLKTIIITFLATVVVVQALVIIGLSTTQNSGNVIAHADSGIVWDSTNVLILNSTVDVIGSTVELHDSVVKNAECKADPS